jgi:hypothetical protein
LAPSASFWAFRDSWLASNSLPARNRKYVAATIEPTVVAISTAVSTTPNVAIHGLRLANRQYRSVVLTGRARIASPRR